MGVGLDLALQLIGPGRAAHSVWIRRNRLSLLADGYFFTVAAIALVGFVYSWSRAWRRA
jgi:hypothetical protein